ncbi:MAG: ABC transporter permease subunit [Armatimonadetes bacterium]|nr:ABC transporter permease subunit [Armatimonadota bacterium]
MPIITVVGRKQRKIRILIAALYIILSAGAVTMVYPFLLMVSTSFTSPVDQNQFRIIPRYFYSEDELYRKYVEAKYGEEIVKYNAWLGEDLSTFEELQPPKNVNRRFVEEWRQFKNSLPIDHMMLAHSFSLSRITPEIVYKYRNFLKEKFSGDLERFNKTYIEANETWMEVQMPVEDWTQRNFIPEQTKKYREFFKFKKSQAPRYLITVSVDGLFQEYLRLSCGDINTINKALGSHYKKRADIHLTARVPNSPMADEWESFVRKECPVHFIRIDAAATPLFQSFLRKKYGTVAYLNKAYRTNLSSFEQVSLPQKPPKSGMLLVDWIEFLQSAVPIKMVELQSPEVLFRAHLANKFGTIEKMNKTLGTRFASFQAVAPPYAENDLVELLENTSAIRREFIVRNYREVIDYIALHGRALINTAILCIALVLTTLTVNPLCAYALSRFNLKSTYKILLFLLATMAFPAEVSAIPSFLLIKELHLLGTYWAIILPGLANGYSIFLLKGFFDSLPKELYEAAVMDGATEMQMYRKITLQLSKPVLAVIALGAFTAAYGSFMWAFLVLQNPKMWTLMVWLYQMQIWAPQFLVYAGLVLAAIPTLLVFIFCQNIIMRGIIVPSEK